MLDDLATVNQRIRESDQRVVELQAQLMGAQQVESQLADLKSAADLARADADHETDAQASLKKEMVYCDKMLAFLETRKALKPNDSAGDELAITGLRKQQAYYKSALR